MKYIDELSLNGKRVFIRADLDVPIEGGKVVSDTRLQAALPTIRYALNHNARVILAGHAGRPKGKKNNEFTLAPVAARLSELLDFEVVLAPDCRGPEVEALVEALAPGKMVLLENLRFYEGEEKNDPQFAADLAKLADVYVNNAFATSHRAHASIAGIAPLVSEKAGGLTLKEELTSFARALENPQRPLVAIFGGSKVSTKLAAIENVLLKADAILVGGAMANTFLAAEGFAVGKSLHEPELLEKAREIRARATQLQKKLLIPCDVIVAEKLDSGVATTTVPISAITASDMALDIGPGTLASFRKVLSDARTVVWNGPMGAFETPEFNAGTFGLIDALAESKAFTIVGGGDTDYALHQKNAFEKMGYVSTAGGAFLELLEGKALPGVTALN